MVRCASHPGTEYTLYVGNLQEEMGKLERLSVFSVAASPSAQNNQIWESGTFRGSIV